MISDYFYVKSKSFEDTLNIDELNTLILNIDGISGIRTINGDYSDNGIKFYQYNPYYPNNLWLAPPTNIFQKIFVPTLGNTSIQSLIQQIIIKN
jgi:hypothetical protein